MKEKILVPAETAVLGAQPQRCWVPSSPSLRGRGGGGIKPAVVPKQSLVAARLLKTGERSRLQVLP